MVSARYSSTATLHKHMQTMKTKQLFSHQQSLPKLPVPALKDTITKYLRTIKPLLNEEEFARSTQICNEFLNSPKSAELQRALLKRAEESQESWLYQWWNELAYMKYRDPVVPYVSYYFQYADEKKNVFFMDQLGRAAGIISAAAKFRELVISGDLAPESVKSGPLSSDQYFYIFNSCRIPETGCDATVISEDYANNAYAVIVYHNKFYKLAYGTGKDIAGIRSQLASILKMESENSVWPIGALTSNHRDEWTKDRKLLISSDSRNETALKLIENAAFVICLDDSSPVTREDVGRELWHGDGRNRFYDKPLQFIVFKNAKAGFLGEHSMMDGTPTSRLNEFVINELKAFEGKSTFPHSSAPLSLPTEIKFYVNEELKRRIMKAIESFKSHIDKHEISVLPFYAYGKGLIKKFGMSPDAYVQMAIQLGYYKMFRKSAATYESSQTRMFQFGRTEVTRTVSVESDAFVKAMCDPTISKNERMNLLRNAVSSHSKYMEEAVKGMGVDRHLLGLKLLASAESLPEIFKDPAFSKSSNWVLSTSQISSEYYDGYGWSEVVPEGFGIPYMVNENWLLFTVTSRKQGSKLLTHYISEALMEMKELCESIPNLKSKF